MLGPILEKLRNRPLLGRIISNTSWQLTDKVLRLVVNLAVGIWVARYLGPMNFGLLNFAIAFVALFQPLSDLGLQAIMVRDLVKRPEQRAQIIASALILRTLGAVVSVALAVGYIVLSRPGSPLSQLAVLAVALSLFAQTWDVVDFDFQSRMHSRPVVVIRSTSLVVFGGIKVGLILANADFIWFAWAVTGEVALSALLMSILLKTDLRQFSITAANRPEMKRLLEDCWPLAVASLSVILYMRIDQVMLGQLLDDSAVGVFSAAVRVSEAWYFVPMAIGSSIAPALTAAHRASEKDYRDKLSVLMSLMLYLAVAVALVLTFCSGPLIDILYGSSYVGSADVLAVHAWAGIFVGLGIAAGPWFVNAGLLKIKMVQTVAGAAVNILLNLYMIPRFGPMGAAVSTLISYSLAAFWLNALSRSTRPLFFIQIGAVLMKRRAAA